MAEKKNFILYKDQIHLFEALTDEQAGKLIKHIFNFVNGINLDSDSLTNIAFIPIKMQLKRDLKSYEKKCEKNTENANVRWNKNNANGCERINDDAKYADNDNEKDNDNDTIINTPIVPVLKYDLQNKWLGGIFSKTSIINAIEDRAINNADEIIKEINLIGNSEFNNDKPGVYKRIDRIITKLSSSEIKEQESYYKPLNG